MAGETDLPLRLLADQAGAQPIYAAPSRPRWLRQAVVEVGRPGTALVPTAVSDPTDESSVRDGRDSGDGHEHISAPHEPAGGRAVAGSNPVSPTRRAPRPDGARGVCGCSPQQPAVRGPRDRQDPGRAALAARCA